jgi:hypothetical protein
VAGDQTSNRTDGVGIHDARYEHSYQSQSSLFWSIRVDVAIAYSRHGSEGPIQTEYVFRINISMIDSSNYKPTVWIGKFVVTDYEEKASYPMGDKGDQND